MWILREIWTKLVLASDDPATRGEAGFAELAEAEGVGDVNLSAFAKQHGIEYVRCDTHNEPNVVELLERIRPELVAFTGGGIIRKPILEAAGRGVFSAHMGPLPEYRGVDVVEWSLVEKRLKETWINVPIHFMEDWIDTGPIVAVRHVPIMPGDTMERLRKRFEPVMIDLTLGGMRGIRDGTVEPRKQRLEDGRQYFVMPPRFSAVARREFARAAGTAPTENA